jgi:hypothetical protein
MTAANARRRRLPARRFAYGIREKEYLRLKILTCMLPML